MKYEHWQIPAAPEDAIKTLMDAGYPYLVSSVLAARGVTTSEQAAEALEREKTLAYSPFLMKDMDKAVARIRAAIRHTRTTLANSQIAQSGKFTAGDLTIDYDKHQVLVRGENAKLTVNEYKIVALLGKYAGKVLTYDFIIRELWGPKAKADNQILRVNMANIRRKIEETPGQPQYIFTEVGVGYRMREGD